MNREYSGRFLLRIDPAFHKRLVDEARKERLSINGLCARLLRDGLKSKGERPEWLAEVRALVGLLKKRFGSKLLGVAAFGSRVQGTSTDESDLDLLVVLDGGVPIQRALYAWWDGAVKSGGRFEVNPHFVHLPGETKEAGGIWFEAAMSSEVIWERGRRLSSTIGELRGLIEGDRVRRHWSNGQPYWVRRGDEEQGSRA